MGVVLQSQPKTTQAQERILRIQSTKYRSLGLNRNDRIIVIACDHVISDVAMVAASRGQFWIGLVSIIDCARLKITHANQSIMLQSDQVTFYQIVKVLPAV